MKEKKEKTEKKEDKERNKTIKRKLIKRFDIILKDLFFASIGKLLKLVGLEIKGKIKKLPEELRFYKTLRSDIIIETKDVIVHIEIQKENKEEIPERMLLYFLALKNMMRKEIEEGRRKREKKIFQIVIWVGKGSPPPSEYKENDTLIHKYKVIDMNKINPDFFLRSRNPNDILLAVISGKKKGKREVVREVVEKLRKVVKDKKKFIKYSETLSDLSYLYDFKIDEEVFKDMEKIYIDLRKTGLYKFLFEKGVEKGRAEGIKEGEIKGLLKGERKGKIEGLKEAILLGVEIKFGKNKVGLVRRKIEGINSIEKLKVIKSEVLKASSLEEFLKSIQKLIRNSNNKSIKLNSKRKARKR